jgi:hypothetical protein
MTDAHTYNGPSIPLNQTTTLLQDVPVYYARCDILYVQMYEEVSYREAEGQFGPNAGGGAIPAVVETGSSMGWMEYVFVNVDHFMLDSGTGIISFYHDALTCLSVETKETMPGPAVVSLAAKKKNEPGKIHSIHRAFTSLPHQPESGSRFTMLNRSLHIEGEAPDDDETRARKKHIIDLLTENKIPSPTQYRRMLGRSYLWEK